MSKINSSVNRVYPVDYMFKKVEELTNLIETDVIETKAKVDGHDSLLAESVQQLNDFKFSYSYNADGSVQTITQKKSDDTVISTTTFTYLANGDVDTSVKVMNGVTVTTKYNYDANGNLTDTVNTKA